MSVALQRRSEGGLAVLRHLVTAEELAQAAGVSVRSAGQYLRGKVPSASLKQRLAPFLAEFSLDPEVLWPLVPPLLQGELAHRGITVKQLAQLAGMKSSRLHTAIRGQIRPSPSLRAALHPHLRALGIDPVRAWTPMSKSPPPHLSLVPADGDQAPAPSLNTPTPEDDVYVSPREYLTNGQLEKLGLADDPFEDILNPEDAYLSRNLKGIEAALRKAVQRRRIVALVGQPGAGKSTLLRRLAATAARQRTWRVLSCSTLDRSAITSSSLTRALLRDLTGREHKGLTNEDAGEALKAALEDANQGGLHPVLLIDEAHMLSAQALVAIKHVWDSNVLYKLLSVVLVGQLPLKVRMLQDTRVQELTGRTQLLELGQYSISDTADYLRWRLARVGGEADKLFTEDAYKALAARAKHPLWINNLAVQALKYGLSIDELPVRAQHVGRS